MLHLPRRPGLVPLQAVPASCCRSLAAPIRRRKGGWQVSSSGLTVEKFLHTCEKAVALRARIVAALRREFLQELALSARQVLRRFNFNLDVHVAGRLGAQDRHALALQTELLAGLRTFGDPDPRNAAIDGRHFNLTAKRCSGHRNW